MKLVFAGTPLFAAEHLSALAASHHEIIAVVTQPDKPGKRGKKPVMSPVKRLALDLGIPVMQPQRINAEDIRVLLPDLMVVVAYGQILREDLLQTPRLGCINVHASLLPRWRGAAPIQRAILAGDDQTGICIMQMDAGLDTGDVIVRHNVPISKHDNAGSLSTKLSQVGQPALLEAIDQLANGSAVAVKQPEAGATYASKIAKSEARIDWNAAARSIVLQVRAFNPEPVAYSLFEELRVKIWQAKHLPGEQHDEVGVVQQVTKQGIAVSCRDGTILIQAIQLPLGKGSVLNGNDILNSRKDLFLPGRQFI